MTDDQLVDAMATQLHLLEPLLFPRPEFETWDFLSEYGKETYRKRARVCLDELKRLGYVD